MLLFWSKIARAIYLRLLFVPTLHWCAANVEFATMGYYLFVGLYWAIEVETLYMIGWSKTWWRHQMETFSVLLALCAGNSPVTDEFPAQRPVTRRLDVFFDLRLNEQLSKQSWGWLFETPSRSLWRQRNECVTCNMLCSIIELLWSKIVMKMMPKLTITTNGMP